MIKDIIARTRYLIIIAAIFIFLAATTLLVYGGALTIQVIADTVLHAKVSSKGAKTLLLSFIELVDLFLLSTVLYIISIGLYELFVHELPLPKWLEITDLDMLKDKLVGVVVVVLGVLFLGQVITWDGERDLLGYGGAIALVIATLTYFLSQKPKKTKDLKE
jgi:uncharacterized membrane protein YqhA